jgi:GNAT superfamily N-acetyltransferase
MKKTSNIPAPPGYTLVPVRTTYLEMLSNLLPEPPAPPSGCAVERWDRPDVSEYRSLFSAVGDKWGWTGRLILEDKELARIITDRGVEIHRLRCATRVAGFVELDRRASAQTEIAYFGLLPEFIGRGLGGFLLNWAIHRAWDGRPQRVWLHTCEYDHPSALAVYLKAGFRVCAKKTELQPYAEDFLRKFTPGDG